MRALRFARRWIAVGWVLVVGLAVGSLGPVSVPTMGLSFADKVVHLTAYLVVMAWFAQIWVSPRALAAHALFLVLLGVGLEVLQAGTAHRTADAFDAIANTCGVLLGGLTAATPAAGLLERLEARLRR